jgi:hypothetical protein
MSRSTKVGRRSEQVRRARERRRRVDRRLRRAWWAIAAGPALVVLLVLVKLAIPEGTVAPVAAGPLPDDVAAALQVDPSTLDAVGRGSGVTPPTPITGQPPLTAGDKPLVIYFGADYCPFCAAQRWALVIALNRFGSFTGLRTAFSSSEDVFPSTATMSFHGSTYESDFLAFEGVELAGSEKVNGRYPTLDTPTPAQQAVLSTYDAPPYVPAQSAGAVPFIDFGNLALMSGASFSPGLLKGMTQQQIADAIRDDPDGTVGQAILGAANAFTAAICRVTGNQPASVCSTAAATAYQQEVGG